MRRRILRAAAVPAAVGAVFLAGVGTANAATQYVQTYQGSAAWQNCESAAGIDNAVSGIEKLGRTYYCVSYDGGSWVDLYFTY